MLSPLRVGVEAIWNKLSPRRYMVLEQFSSTELLSEGHGAL